MGERKRVGFIGLGLMGHGMAENILQKGFPLTVLAHRNRQPVEDLLARGAKEAQSAAELAKGADVVILCVTGSPQVEDALFRRDGLLEGVHEGLVVVDSSTGDPEYTLKAEEAVRSRGGRFMDAPVNRTPKDAEEVASTYSRAPIRPPSLKCVRCWKPSRRASFISVRSAPGTKPSWSTIS
jgi:3-hydroxyisobutyrate dehydrogenase-like beta-hydroxyacid dehydrogenase